MPSVSVGGLQAVCVVAKLRQSRVVALLCPSPIKCTSLIKVLLSCAVCLQAVYIVAKLRESRVVARHVVWARKLLAQSLSWQYGHAQVDVWVWIYA